MHILLTWDDCNIPTSAILKHIKSPKMPGIISYMKMDNIACDLYANIIIFAYTDIRGVSNTMQHLLLRQILKIFKVNRPTLSFCTFPLSEECVPIC